MSDRPLATFADTDAQGRPLYLIAPDQLDTWRAGLPMEQATWIAAIGFKAAPGEVVCLPDAQGEVAAAVLGLGQPEAQMRTRFAVAQAAAKLPAGPWRIEADLTQDEWAEIALAWLLSGYAYSEKANRPKPHTAALIPDPSVDVARSHAIAEGEALTRDLINTPANRMGPAELEAAALTLAETFGASASVIRGDALIDQNFPLIHTVGRASPRAPRLIDLRWGMSGPRLTLVGKGVCFDTGGLNLKPGASMGLMKKDMGGAANVLGLAHMIMSLDVPVQLRVLIPAVENAVSGSAFRPGDILPSRAGHTVEINNTDAEGRLVLADALCLGAEETPDLMVSMATLTGAARVAVGPDIAPFFCDDSAFAAVLEDAGHQERDPVWRLPFHPPYEAMIEPGVADLDNAPKGGFAGAITAALFLRRFAKGAQSYAHFDVYGWQPTAAPARPVGGVGQGGRALLAALPQILDLSA